MDEDSATEIQKKADRFESQYNNIKKEFKDYIDTSRRNEEIKKKELRSDSAKKMLVIADSLCRMSVTDQNCSCDVVKNNNENFQKNLDVMYQQLLVASGLTPVDPAPGDNLDNTRHMAVGIEYGSLYPEDTVFRVIRKGYCSENMVIRPAEVIISKRPCEPIKRKKTGIWENFTCWMFPAKRRFAGIDQQIDELKQVQNQKNLILQQEMAGLQDFFAESVAEKQKIDELCHVQGEKIEQFEQEIEALHDFLTESEADTQKFDELENMLNEKTGKLEREIIALKNCITHEQDEKQKIREIEHILYEITNQFEQKFLSLENKITHIVEDNQNTEPVLGKNLVRTDEEMPVQNYPITHPVTEDQKTDDDEPVLDEDSSDDQKTDDDESVLNEDSSDDQKTDDDEPVLDEDSSDDQKIEDDESVLNEDSSGDQKPEDGEPVMDEDTIDDNKKCP